MKNILQVILESQSFTLEDIAKLIKPYVKQWYKYHSEDNNWSDNLEPVKNIKDGIVRMGSKYDNGEWDSLEFELKCGETGRIQHQLTDGMRSKVSFINGFTIYLDSSDGPFDGYKFRYMSSPNLKSAIEHIKRLNKGK